MTTDRKIDGKIDPTCAWVSLILLLGSFHAVAGDALPFQSGPARDSFISSAKQSCARSVDGTKILKGPEVEAYCDCLAKRMADSVTAEEARFVLTNGKPPASMHDKAVQFAPICMRATR
jgi:hypothetical protein